MIVLILIGVVLLEKPLPRRQVVSSPSEEGYGVVVIGAEPEGIAAAIGAAQAGVKVLLLERRDRPGGLFTFGWLNMLDMNYGPKNEVVTQGVFEEFLRECDGTSFDVEHAFTVFENMLARETNITALYNVSQITPVLENGRVAAVTAVTPAGESTFRGSIFVDTTQDAEVAAMAGVPFTVGGEDRGDPECMGVTLVFKLSGTGRALRQASKETGDSTNWGFWPVMKNYQPSDPRIRVRGLNIGWQRDGSVLINSLTVFGANALDSDSYNEAYQLAQLELPRVVAFIKENIPSMANVELSGYAPELYVRETRHIKGDYILSVSDVLGNRYFPDQIAVGSYPVDIQATNSSNYGWVFGKPIMYSIPLRCLVPQGVDDLLVAGRSASYSSLAAGSTRVVPVGMATGQAAGVAAALAASEGVTPLALANNPDLVKRVQDILVSQGAYLPVFNLTHAMANHWAYEALEELQRLGLVDGGYDNNYRLQAPMTLTSFRNLASNAFKRTFPSVDPPNGLMYRESSQQVQLGQAVEILDYLLRNYNPSQYVEPFGPTHPRLQGLDANTLLVNAQGFEMVVEALKLAR